MAKRAISVTLDTTNLVWLKARVGAGGVRSVSELIDRLIAEARRRGSAHDATSVVGTIDVSSSDPMLLRADASLRALYGSSLDRPSLVEEPAERYRTSRRGRRARRG